MLINFLYCINSLIMFKKKDNLFDVIKKDNEYHLTTFLEENDLFNLSLLSKKYYAQLFPLINLIK